MSKGFEYRGDLTQTTLPEMLYTIQRFQVPGIIEVQHEGVVKRVYVRDGCVVNATSSDLDDSLGGFLRRTGALTLADFERAMGARASTQQRLGSVLVDLEMLAPREVYDAILEHVEAIVWSLFYWNEGEVVFKIGDFEEQGLMRIQVPMRRVILEGIKRDPNAKGLVARLGVKETVFKADYEIEDLIETGLTGEELKLLRLVDGKRTLYEICTLGPFSAADNAKLIYAFHVLNLVYRREGAGALPTALSPAEDSLLTETSKNEASGGKIKIQLKTGWDREGDR